MIDPLSRYLHHRVDQRDAVVFDVSLDHAWSRLPELALGSLLTAFPKPA